MGKVIQFPTDRVRIGAAERLKKVSDQLDLVIIKALESGIDAHEVSGLLSHRLGTLMKNIDHKDELWGICEKVLKRQADIV